MRTPRALLLACGLLCATAARAEDGYDVDVRASTYAQLFQRALVPGASGVLVQPDTGASLYGYAFARMSGVDTPWGEDAVSAELSVWGALGALPVPAGGVTDGDLQAAWVQHSGKAFHLRLGRQVTLPGAARYVRYDGVSGGGRVGPVDLEAYAGLVALPRFVKARGYWTLGSMADALKSPALLEAQSTPGQWLAGARATFAGHPRLRGSVGFHEQHGADGLAFRNLSLDVLGTPPGDQGTAGGRLVFDLAALQPAEARLYFDLTSIPRLPLSFDYAYAAPSLLLPHTSVLAAFGGSSFHELGVDATFIPSRFLRLTGRASGQVYEALRPGTRLSLRSAVTPDLDGRWSFVGELARVSAPDNGYVQLRAAARYRATVDLVASLDAAVYRYDAPVRGVSASLVGFANLEYTVTTKLRAMVSGSVANTPFAAVDAQVLLRLVYELGGPGAGGGV